MKQKRNQKMVRLVPKDKQPKKASYNDVDTMNWLIYNDKNIDDGKQKFSKGNNGDKSQK